MGDFLARASGERFRCLCRFQNRQSNADGILPAEDYGERGVINPASTREIITPVGPGKQCGLGGGSMKDDKIITHIHGGTALHYQALELAEAGKDRTIIILSNQRQGNVYDIAAAIEAILDNRPYQSLSEITSKTITNHHP